MMKGANLTYTVTVKLKPYLQEYLACKSNDNVNGSLKTFLGAIVRPFIDYLPPEGDPYFYKKLEGYKKEDFLEITVPVYKGMDTRNGTAYMPESNFRDFERIINVHFWDLFYNYVDDKIRYNKRIKRIIIQFCTDYHITYNRLTYDMLKKAYYRKSIKKKSGILATISSLSCPPFFLM
jgi:hypothetical protein